MMNGEKFIKMMFKIKIKNAEIKTLRSNSADN